MRILFFGDSITYGIWDLEHGGWVQRLINQYNTETFKNLAGEWRELYNLGVTGNTTASIVKRLSYEVENRRWQDDPFAFVFAVGINDTQFAGDEKMATPQQYKDELDVLISSARHYSDKLLFVGLSPVDDELCNPWLHSVDGVSFKNERILDFEEVLRKACIAESIPHVQVFEKFKDEMGRNKLLADGLHPNEAGHALIAELVKPALDKLLA